MEKARIKNQIEETRTERVKLNQALRCGIRALLGDICRKIDNISCEVGDVGNEEIKDELDELSAECVWDDKYAGAMALMLSGYMYHIGEQIDEMEVIINTLIKEQECHG